MQTVARLYKQNGYRRASVTTGPGEALVLRSDAEAEITRLRDVLAAIVADHEDGRGYTHLDDELADMAAKVLAPNAELTGASGAVAAKRPVE